MQSQLTTNLVDACPVTQVRHMPESSSQDAPAGRQSLGNVSVMKGLGSRISTGWSRGAKYVQD